MNLWIIQFRLVHSLRLIEHILTLVGLLGEIIWNASAIRRSEPRWKSDVWTFVLFSHFALEIDGVLLCFLNALHNRVHDQFVENCALVKSFALFCLLPVSLILFHQISAWRNLSWVWDKLAQILCNVLVQVTSFPPVEIMSRSYSANSA